MVASNVLLCLLGTASGFMLAPPLQTRTTIRAAELSEEQAKEAYYTAVNQFFWKNNMGLLASLAIGGKNEVVTVDQATLDAAFMEINGPAIDAKVADVAKVVGMSATECKTKLSDLVGLSSIIGTDTQKLADKLKPPKKEAAKKE